MNRQSLGCFSFNGILAVGLSLLAIGWAYITRGGQIFSPGPLSAKTGQIVYQGVRSHAETGRDCAACHVPFWGLETMATRCLECHNEIASQLVDSSGLHGRLYSVEQAWLCRDCHTEHHGAAAPLTVFDPIQFPHQATGFSLRAHTSQGSATPITCLDCHPTELVDFVPATCVQCHYNLQVDFLLAHVDAFGRDCLACHDGQDRFGSSFSHAATEFQLTGGHTATACIGCHRGAMNLTDLGSAPQACYGCHASNDAHQGRFGRTCEGCHTAEGWELATIDHSKTAFPLTGVHVNVPCTQCHAEGVFQGTPTACAACHQEPAYHQGLFENACAVCHTTDGWTPALFDRAHRFPVNHGERGVSSCQTCHPGTLASYTCYTCHEHEPAEIEREHVKEGISNFQDCTRCHPTGLKE